MNFVILSGFNLLAVNPGLVFWTVVTFLTVLLCLWLFAWKPLLQAIDQRNDKIENDLNESAKLREEADALVKEYKKKIDLALQEASKILDESRKNAEKDRQRIIEKAESEIMDMKRRFEEDIKQAKSVAIHELQDKVSDLVILILSKIMNEDIDGSKHKALIDKVLVSSKIEYAKKLG